MRHFEHDVEIFPASTFHELIYFCTSDGECTEEPAPTNLVDKLTGLLDARGREGWELVQVILSRAGVVTFWKREID